MSLLRLLQTGTAPQSWFFVMLTLLERTGQWFWRMSLNFGLFHVFNNRIGFMNLGPEYDSNNSVPFPVHHIRRNMTSLCLTAGDVSRLLQD